MKIALRISLLTLAVGTSCQVSRPAIVSEGALRGVRVAHSLGAKPGSEPGFYNLKRRVGRDFAVLSVAQWLSDAASSKAFSGRSARLLDATCGAGMQGLRAAVESRRLARAANVAAGLPEPPPLKVVLNDRDDAAADVASRNAAGADDVTVTNRPAQSLLHDESFEIAVLDPFGSTVPFLDASFAGAPHGGRLEICATDLGSLYGQRPSVTRRHYGARLAWKPRPPCYRERGVRLLLAAAARAAGRHGRGIAPLFGVSAEHFCLASVKVVRGARGADESAEQVRTVRICSKCGAYGLGGDAPRCECDPDGGGGNDAREEGPLWIGDLFDVHALKGMAQIANLEEADGLFSKETRALLSTIDAEASVKGMFHRRPADAAVGKTPKLVEVMNELHRRGYAVARTHFDDKALRTDAGPAEFDSAVRAVVSKGASRA